MNTREMTEALGRGEWSLYLNSYTHQAFVAAGMKDSLANAKRVQRVFTKNDMNAALALLAEVLPGWRALIDIGFFLDGDVAAQLIGPDGSILIEGEVVDGKAPTPAAALCIAILRAEEAKEQDR